MARNKNIAQNKRRQWTTQFYLDHTSQPAALLAYKATTPEPEAIHPAFAIQVCTTVALDQENDLIAICRYLSRKISTSPWPSFEIYCAPQIDVFACVEHQRREIFHRKDISPSRDEGLFPEIAKVALSREDPEHQGVILVINSYSFRGYRHYAGYEAETARVDLPPPKPDDDEEWEDKIWPEREELVARNQRDDVIEDYVYDYSLGKDEGNPNRSVGLPRLEVIEAWQRRTDLLSEEITVAQSCSDKGAIVQTSGPVLILEPGLSNENPLTLEMIGRAFTATILESLPQRKIVNFEFHSGPNQSLGDDSVVSSRPTSGQRARKLPQKRYNRGHPILDRPDFLTGPEVLFFLTNKDEITNEAMQNVYNLSGEHNQPSEYTIFQVWRSVRIQEVARRLAMVH
ncbi:uncharacterized protein BO87DRAFT_409151 [Aspergillus neoniger CBS 115656]|uniref:Uncharacterized protein n=1 Tax=Aspergillus neoniger (strain CBS 115656) TaxID=1448310 RepID=A0A318YAE1_ASPNB|nr:hypothetical protein BO87DRAFT_409151 [Aspergillus neoniger CBS 115656]PYH31315.1 hypothetical protein BO87DRAFT_409151 [Aspergillus neoniger CBS 115656]